MERARETRVPNRVVIWASRAEDGMNQRVYGYAGSNQKEMMRLMSEDVSMTAGMVASEWL